jgi:hypothetical protein
LLFLAMGAAVASGLEIPNLAVYETGVGCLNLPMSSAQVGSQGTRAMHPFTLSEANKLFELVLDQRVRVIAPFFLHTKRLLCCEVGEALPKLASVTASCDEGEGHKSDAMEHCGLCTSCIFRRIALASDSRLPDRTPYRDQPTRHHGAFELSAFEHHSAELAGGATFQDLIKMDPDVRFALRAPMEVQLDHAEMEERVLAMYGSYQAEIAEFFKHHRPVLRPRLKPLRKEGSRDLFAAAG